MSERFEVQHKSVCAKPLNCTWGLTELRYTVLTCPWTSILLACLYQSLTNKWNKFTTTQQQMQTITHLACHWSQVLPRCQRRRLGRCLCGYLSSLHTSFHPHVWLALPAPLWDVTWWSKHRLQAIISNFQVPIWKGKQEKMCFLTPTIYIYSIYIYSIAYINWACG